MSDNFTITTPHAAVIVWNYIDRTNANGANVTAHLTEPAIIGTSSVISISTVKRKSSPVGTFEIRLAPRFNWVSRITPGSWCAILMSREKLPTMSQTNIGKASETSLKMIGRIESVRGVVDVNPETGARSTVFLVTGVDWGSVFETSFYIDYAVAQSSLVGNTPATSATILGLQNYADLIEKQKLVSPADLVNVVISMWGAGHETAMVNAELLLAQASSKVKLDKLLLATATQFKLPAEVATYMGSGNGVASVSFSSLIRREHGVLKEFDDPDASAIPGPPSSPYNKVSESAGMLNPGQFMGVHTFWQMLTDVSNSTLYELVSDIRWDAGKPYFTLYHRVRPFVTRPNFTTYINEATATASASTVKGLTSLFSNVRRIKIPLRDVNSINFGTNWRDRVNFIELRPTSQMMPKIQGTSAKIYGQTVDRFSYQRDGFKPMFENCSFLPTNTDGMINVEKLAHWKHLLREWYFNTHLMLNGSVTFVGQSKYIQVGDNIMIDSRVLGQAPITGGQTFSIGSTYLTAHVENISHSFAVDPNSGARTYSTTVQFVRGVITDSAGKLNQRKSSPPEAGAIDKLTTTLIPTDERNGNTFGTSVETDPDAQKLNKGNPKIL